MLNRIIWALLAIGTLSSNSEVAFTSLNEMKKEPVHILKNEIIRNIEPTNDTLVCIYFREYIAKYKFQNPKHQHIYYFQFQCLDINFDMIRTETSFNYDGSDEMSILPEGCVPPVIEKPPENPCQYGFDLGEDLIKNISTMLAKKLINHPSRSLPSNEITSSISIDKLIGLNRRISGLEKVLEQVIEDNHASNPANKKPDHIVDNEDGTQTTIYFIGDETAERTVKESGEVQTVVYKVNGTIILRMDYADNFGQITHYDKDGNPRLFKSIEPVEGHPDLEKIISYNLDEEPIGEPLIRNRFENIIPVDVDLSAENEKDFKEAADLFAETLEKYVKERITCFSESIINIEENYLTFVCASEGHISIKKLMEQKFGESMVCGRHLDCDRIQGELLDKMLTDINNGGDGSTAQVVVDSVTQEFQTPG